MSDEKELYLLKSIENGTLVNKVDEDVVYEDGESATEDLRTLIREKKYIQTEFIDCGWINQLILGLTDKGKDALKEKA